LNSFEDDVSGGDENAPLCAAEQLPFVGDRGDGRGGEEKLRGDRWVGLWKAHDDGDRAGIGAAVATNMSAAGRDAFDVRIYGLFVYLQPWELEKRWASWDTDFGNVVDSFGMDAGDSDTAMVTRRGFRLVH
jgi:hypothetical protein